jgi:hypothetical protein
MHSASSQGRQLVRGIRQWFAENLPGPVCRLICCLLLLFTAHTASAGGDGLFLQHLTLVDGRVVVVEEAALEPRSIGSFSIRLYSGVNSAYPFDDFVSGIIVPRDGFVERLVLEDIDGDDDAELIVVLRSAGTGSYQYAKAFALTGNSVKLVAEVDDLQSRQDPIERLRR